MSQTVTDERLTTADIANSPRPTQISNANDAGRDPDFPDLRKDTIALPADSNTASATNAAANTDAHAPLFPENETRDLRTRWDKAQGMFVDEPRKAVEEADALVANAVKRIAELFADERAKLEQQWDRGDNVSTEDLRVALRRYRSFFERLLSFQ
ncbi:MAG TPA: hypothetical protein VGU25_17740 [Acidobacteriaceae bacterium]|nr:hypothetical protein [Acidobacteriaceae bacterium]